MRAYDVLAASSALAVSPKWLDNVLSHHRIAGVRMGGRGVRRQLGFDALLHLATATALIRELDLPIAPALALAARAIRLHHDGVQLPLLESPALTIHISVSHIAADLERALASVSEFAVPPRRGRPPRRPRME